jgi:hypothetical protein
MLRFTAQGAVSAPASLQVRVSVGRPGGRLVGLADPSRHLSAAEVVLNLEHFTVRRRGPRQRAIEQIVLSGRGLQGFELGEALRRARGSGVTSVVLHVDPLDLVGEIEGWITEADRWVCVVGDHERFDAAIGVIRRAPVPVEISLGADREDLGEWVAQALAAGASRIIASAPVEPGDASLPELARAVEPLARAQGTAVVWKGFAPCQWPGGGPPEGWRTKNRWYVDADHQLDSARLFVPDLLRFTKGDACRFCDYDGRCDGVSTRWFEAGRCGPLRPLSG